MNLEQLEDIHCPICMAIFKRPTTISCGHTFCQSCLSASFQTVKNCPICRNVISIYVQNNKQDINLGNLVKQLEEMEGQGKDEEKDLEWERMVVIEVKSEELVLPFNRAEVSFELEDESLIDKMERFVVKQQFPYDRYAIICNYLQIQPLRLHLYRATFKAIAFCHIQSTTVEQSINSKGHSYFYRTCLVKPIVETSSASVHEFDQFFANINKISSCPEYKSWACEKVDVKLLAESKNGVELFYGVMGMLALPKEQKYQLAISLDEEKRIKSVKEFLNGIENRIQSHPEEFVNMTRKTSWKKWLLLACLFVLCIVLIGFESEL